MVGCRRDDRVRGIGTLVLTGVGGIVLHRLATIGTIEMRLAIWEGALTAWSAHPITGGGPGTFPFLLQPTGYFDASSYAPPHADNLYVQALAELGLLGVGALAVLAAIVVRRWIRRPPSVARDPGARVHRSRRAGCESGGTGLLRAAHRRVGRARHPLRSNGCDRAGKMDGRAARGGCDRRSCRSHRDHDCRGSLRCCAGRG